MAPVIFLPDLSFSFFRSDVPNAQSCRLVYTRVTHHLVSAMRYVDVIWVHSDVDTPIRLVSEIGSDGFKTRKVEFFLDDRVDRATVSTASGDIQLGDQPVPPLEEINSQCEFRGIEFDAAIFEAL